MRTETRRFHGLAAVAALACSAATCPAQLTGDLRAHDPSRVLKVDGKYYVFATGRGVVTKSSPDLHVWTDGEPVLPEAPAWVREVVPRWRRGFWAPDAIKVGDRYLLFYSASTFGSQISGIGVATNATLDPADPKFEWEDQGVVVLSSADTPYNAIDPAALLDDDGRLWLVFGSYWKGIYVVELDPATGKRLDPSKPATHLARNPDTTDIEAAYIHKHDDRYYLFVNWGQCCRGVRSTYNIRIGRGDSPTGPFLDKTGKDLTNGGGSMFLETEGREIGPGHASVIEDDGVKYLSYHFYDGDQRGRPKLGLRLLEWDAEGWPVTKPLSETASP
jgi:arabinan endo-1,5-alpha-L-arabinosidase